MGPIFCCLWLCSHVVVSETKLSYSTENQSYQPPYILPLVDRFKSELSFLILFRCFLKSEMNTVVSTVSTQ